MENFKKLINDDLTNSAIFKFYDACIEPVISDWLTKFYINSEDIPDLQLYDATDAFPLSDPGNELVFILKLDFFSNSIDQEASEAFSAFQTLVNQTSLLGQLNNNTPTDTDHLFSADALFSTNADGYIIFTGLK